MKKKAQYNIAIVGARGAVGSEMRTILAGWAEKQKFPLGKAYFYGSKRSQPSEVPFLDGKKEKVIELTCTDSDFKGKDIDIVLSSPGSAVSKRFAPYAVKAGAVVIDNTSAFRMDPEVPLVIPEINASDIEKHKGIIANPNCSAIVLLMAVAPLYRKNRIKRIVCATYQSASGAGMKAMLELEQQTRDLLAGKPIKKEVFPHQIAFNLFSHNTPIGDDALNEEERKVVQESRKILHDDEIKIAVTCVRVPVFRAHSQAIFLEFERKMTADEAREILAEAPGIKLVDDRAANHFPMPVEASGRDEILTGRLREDPSAENGLALFVSGDQLRKGAALNAIQIAQHLICHSSAISSKL